MQSSCYPYTDWSCLFILNYAHAGRLPAFAIIYMHCPIPLPGLIRNHPAAAASVSCIGCQAHVAERPAVIDASRQAGPPTLLLVGAFDVILPYCRRCHLQLEERLHV